MQRAFKQQRFAVPRNKSLEHLVDHAQPFLSAQVGLHGELPPRPEPGLLLVVDLPQKVGAQLVVERGNEGPLPILNWQLDFNEVLAVGKVLNAGGTGLRRSERDLELTVNIDPGQVLPHLLQDLPLREQQTVPSPFLAVTRSLLN